MPGFKKKFDPREKKFTYQKAVGIGECAVMSSLFAVNWQGAQCYVDEAHFPILTISTTDRYFAETHHFEMPMFGYWLKDVDAKECIDFSHTIIRRKGKGKEEEMHHLTTTGGKAPDFSRGEESMRMSSSKSGRNTTTICVVIRAILKACWHASYKKDQD